MEELTKKKTVWDYIDEYEYIINVFVIGVPWSLIGAVMIGSNIFFNITANRFWAAGNVFLLFNTAYGFALYLHSILLVMEVDMFLKWMKFIRLGVVLLSFLTFAVFGYIAVRLGYLTFVESGSNMVSMIESMFLTYNLFLHLPILAFSFVIVVKEISMEFFQFVKDDAGAEGDDISLGFHDILLLFDDVLYLVDPFAWTTNQNTIQLTYE